MRYLSVCSGVEAASVAWHDLGWIPVGFSEIEPFPSAVLAHRFPDVKNYGDMTKYKEWDIEPGTVDVLVGGTPCQSFSVAGLRKGLDDPRGNLMLVYLGLAEHLRVPWLVWENVPGVLSSNGGRDFGTFLGALGQLGYRWSFRVLDAQHFGVPQRRRRVFVVAHLGDGSDPAKVLFEPESLRGDTAKGGKARQGAPRGAGKGAPSGGRPFRMTAFGQYEDDDSGSTCKQRDYKDATDLVVQPVAMRESGQGYWLEDTVSGTIDASMGQSGHANRVATIAVAQPTMAVRRLTPRECERLQGFPDDWTLIPWRGKPAPDGPRYKAMGNSMAVPVMRWIGQRLDRVAKGER
jgi:DNA (cytosine-5)-methyltransferase 1